MTTLVHGSRPAQHSGLARIAATLASVGAVITHWAEVRDAVPNIVREANLGARAQRLIRSGD